MSLDIKEIEGGKRTQDVQSGITSTRLFKVVATSGENKKAVLDGLGIAIGDADPEDTNLYCKSLDCSRLKSSPGNIVYSVTVNYTSVATELTGVGSTGGDPLEANAVYSLDFAKQEDAANYFADGSLIKNSAGDPIKGLTKNSSYAVMRVTRNEAAYAVSVAAQYVDHVNSDTFYGFTAGNAYCNAINATTQRTPTGVVYFQVSYEIWLNLNPDIPAFKWKILDEGKRKKVDGKLVPITQKGGTEVTDPVLLDGSGLPLDPVTDPEHYIEGAKYPSVAFSGMNL